MASKNESSVHVPKPEIIVPEIYLINLRKKEIFRNLPFSKSDRKGKGVILVTCSDGHVFPNLFKFLLNFFEFIHVIADNGGPLLLSVNSTMRTKMLESIKAAYEIKGFETVLALNHAFCSGAALHNFVLDKTVAATFDASSMIEDYLGTNDVSVVPGYSIDYRKFSPQYLGERNPRILTYKLSPHNLYTPSHI